MNKYVKPVGIAVLVVCTIFLAGSLMRHNRLKKEARADAALMVAASAADYQAILDQYGNTASAPMALLGLAQAEFNAARVAEAASLYADFLEEYPKHDMAVQAEYNGITCMEALRQYPEAAMAYGDFRAHYASSHLAPVALLGQARCLEALEDFAGAKRVYEDVMAFYPESGWSQLAEQNLSVVNAKVK
jgi:TolA-binding protein